MILWKKATATILALLCAIIAPFSANASPTDILSDVQSAIEGIISYKSSTYDAVSTEDFFDNLSEKAGSSTADWYYIALSLYGIDCNHERSIASLKSAVDELYKGDLSRVKVTDLQRISFALLACGCDVTNVNGHKLLADCTYNRANYKPLDSQGVNSVAYALLLLDSNNFPVPNNAATDREGMINLILNKELEKGGFSLVGNVLDIDTTAIAIQALAPYKERRDVSEVLDRSIEILSKIQTDDGGCKSFAGQSCAESTAQVILSLVSLGIDPVSDSRFIKNGNSVFDGLMHFKLESGGFCHFADGTEDNMATYQSLCALVACYRYINGKKTFYDFNVKIPGNTDKADKTISKNHTQPTTRPKTNKTSKTTHNNSNTENKNSEISNESQINTEPVKKNNTKSEKRSKKKKKINKVLLLAETSATEKVVSTSDEVIMKKKDIKPAPIPRQAKPVYIDFVLIFAGYIVLFIVKRKGGKQ